MKSVKRVTRVSMTLLLVMLVSLAISGCKSASKQAIKYGGQYYPGEFLLKGHTAFWQDQDLSVEHILFSSGTEGNQALISGDVDINAGSDSKTVALFNAMPERAVIIATIQRGDRYSTIVRVDSPYQTWEDLKGKTVGTRLGTGAEQVLLRYFDRLRASPGMTLNGST